MKPRSVIVVTGPTGSGKSPIAEEVAKRLGGVLVNADAFQVYRGFDIGTNKPSDRSNYRLLDVCDPTDQFGVGQWVDLASGAVSDILAGGMLPVIVGGTGLYIRALTQGYETMHGPPDDELRTALMRREQEQGLSALVAELVEKAPEVADRVDLANPVRVRRALERLQSAPIARQGLSGIKFYKFGLQPDWEELKTHLANRIDGMLASGWLDEVENILSKPVPITAPAFRAIGYQSLVKSLRGELTLDEAKESILVQTRQYAKRQRTWLRSEPDLRPVEIAQFGRTGVQRAVGEILGALDNGSVSDG